MSTDSYIEARPRTSEDIARLANCPEVLVEARRIGVSKVAHFTTKTGTLGVLAAGAVKSRCKLPQDKYLEHVYQPNADTRKDQAWLDYVNLSIERINDWMFETSSRWHAAEDNPWVVLFFTPKILTHPGVVFTTTNNIYPACKRAEGLVGFSQMFAEKISGRYDKLYDRTDKLPAWPTDRQAEVLYPGELSCSYLQQIVVQREETVETIAGMFKGLHLNLDSVPVRHAPEVFK